MGRPASPPPNAPAPYDQRPLGGADQY
jgi:hypothetical protein